jgi:hypothetical protein
MGDCEMRALERQHLGQLFIYCINTDVPKEEIGAIMWWVCQNNLFLKRDIQRKLTEEPLKDHPYALIVREAEDSNAFGIRG